MAESIDKRKTVLITGCSPGGIGHSLALCLHKRNWRVFATARSASTLQTLADMGIETFSLTVDDESSIQACFSEIQTLVKNTTANSGLDMLINNAGLSAPVPALDLELTVVRRMFETNVFGVMRMVSVFSPLLIAAKGTIVMIGSLAGVMPYVFGAAYNASKAALHAYANTLRVELSPFDVKVITIVTGGVRSRIADRGRRVLPETSMYASLEDVYQRRQGHSQEGAMDNMAYAESVVSQVVPGAGPWPWRWLMRDARKWWVWEGHKAWLVWFLASGWAWPTMLDAYFYREFQLWRLKKGVKKN